MFEQLVNEVRNRFNLGDKALPLVQELVVVIDNPGTSGFIGFIDRFKKNGLGYLIDSWLVSSAPLSINHVQITEIIGSEELAALSSKTGLDKGTLLLALAYLLPLTIRKLAVEPTESNVGQTVSVNEVAEETPKTIPSENPQFQELIQAVGNRFNIAAQASDLVQTTVASITQEGQATLVGRFMQCGLNRLIDSWLNSSAPLAINHVQIEEVLGGKGELLEQLQVKAGLDKGTALLSLAYVLPKLIKHLFQADELDFISVSKNDPIQTEIPVSAITPSQTAIAEPNVQTLSLFAALIENVDQHFNLGQKALPLIQVLVAAATNPEAGGFESFKNRFIDNNLEALVDSWVSSHGTPLAINQVQIEEVLGGKGGLLDSIVSRVAIDKGYALMSLAYVLPTAFNQLAQLDTGNLSLTNEVNALAEQGKQLLGSAYHSASTAAMRVEIPAVEPEAFPKVAVSLSSQTATPENLSEQSNSQTQAKGGMTKYLLWLAAIGAVVVMFQSMLKVPDQSASKSAPAEQIGSKGVATEAKVPAPPQPVTPQVVDKPPVTEQSAPTPNAETNISNEEQIGSKGVAPEAKVPAPSQPVTPQVVDKPPVTEQSSPTPNAETNISNEPPKPVALTPPEQPAASASEPVTVDAVPSASSESGTVKPVQPEQAAPATEPVAIAPAPAPSSEAVIPALESKTSEASVGPSAKLYFDFGKSDLTATAEQQLAPVIDFVKANPGAKVSIIGIIDPLAKKGNSTYAAKNRTQSVQVKLLAAGVEKERIIIEAFQPNQEGAKEARRVELKVSQ